MASLAMSIAKSEFIVGGKYRLMRKIGSGSFGDIYLGINISNGEVRARRRLSRPRLARPTAGLPAVPASSIPSVRLSRFSPRLVSSRRGARSRFPSFDDEAGSDQMRRETAVSAATCRPRSRIPEGSVWLRRDRAVRVASSRRLANDVRMYVWTDGRACVRLDAVEINIS